MLVDRIYRYENLAAAADWMAGGSGSPLPSSTAPTSRPTRDGDVDPGVRALLEQHYADDVRLWESAA